MSMKQMYARLTKVDEEKRLVYGQAAAEVVDRSGEIMDYASSKPHFEKWSAEVSNDTGGKSLGNVRAMHGKVAAGVLKGIEFNDDEKSINVCAHIVDDNEWNKVIKGVYAGFSIGGKYIGDKKVEKMDDRDVTRYTAGPGELSLVDRPCIPTAKFFEVQKADGSMQKVDILEAEEPPTEVSYEVNGSDEDVAALAKFMGENKLGVGDINKFLAGAAEAGVVITEGFKIVEKGLPTVADLRKGFYSCSTFVGVIDSLICLKKAAEYESYVEGDNSPIPARIDACIALCGTVLKEFIDEELKEINAGEDHGLFALSEKLGGLTKLCKADGPTMHQIVHDVTKQLGATCAASADAPVQKLDAAAGDEVLAKAVAAATEPLQKLLAEATERLTKLEAQPARSTISLRAVAKSDDVGPEVAKVDTTPKPIVDDHGEVHEVAGLIKAAHQNGGAPMTKL